jgi:pyridoxal/pyridoxine/pyridoxamine kinase
MGGKDEPLDKELLANIDIVSPNQTELMRMCGDESDTGVTDEQALGMIQ